MKTRILKIFGVAAMATIGMVSCNTDPCKDVVCGVDGQCVEGDCVCDPGYEGATCATVQRDKFIATYNVNESCTSGNFTYSITVTSSSTNISSIIITNFGDYTVNVTGTVNENGTSITIPNQTVGGGNFSGSGQINGDILTITYTVTAGTSTDTCTMTCTKQ